MGIDRQKIERNIVLEILIQAFLRRSYLPIISIYITLQAGLSLLDIGVIASIVALVAVVLEVPSGYISDMYGHRKMIIWGSFVAMISPFFYVFFPSYWGALSGFLLYIIAMSMHSGAVDAFRHDYLVALGRADDFPDVTARLSRWSLIVSIILLAIVPTSYVIDPRLPFLIGGLMHVIVFIAALKLYLPEKYEIKNKSKKVSFRTFLKDMVRSGDITIFFLIGIVGSSMNKIPEIRELYYSDLGIPIVWFGVLLVATRFLAIGATYLAPWFSRMSPRAFYFVDVVGLSLVALLLGINTIPLIAVTLFALMMIHRVIRDVYVRTYLINMCPEASLRATYISFASLTRSVLGVATPMVLGFFAHKYGTAGGYSYYGLIVLVVAITFYTKAYKNLKKVKRI